MIRYPPENESLFQHFQAGCCYSYDQNKHLPKKLAITNACMSDSYYVVEYQNSKKEERQKRYMLSTSNQRYAYLSVFRVALKVTNLCSIHKLLHFLFFALGDLVCRSCLR